MAKKELTAKTNKKVIDILNQIFQSEMDGIVRYLHYSFMIMGHNRIPIQKWFREQAQESSDHLILVGELITSYGGHPPMYSTNIEESHNHTVDQILLETLEQEEHGLELYKKLAKAAGDDIALEEFARGMVKEETDHINEVKKMLRRD